jgi:hypothetical protein
VAISMPLDASYDLRLKLGSKIIFRQNYGNFSFAWPFLDFECIESGIFLKSHPTELYGGFSENL